MNPVAGEFLRKHYGKLFLDEAGKPLKIAQAKEKYPGLFALHSAVKETYKTLFQTDMNKKSRILPSDMKSLAKLVEQRRRNKQLDQHVRLGKLLHYEMWQANGGEGSQGTRLPTSSALRSSSFLTSQGQSRIKGYEAFTRMWHGIIAFAAQLTLKDWIDPKNKFDGDILGKKGNDALRSSEGLDQKARYLFGESASLFTDTKQLVGEILRVLKNLRNHSFHFLGQSQFIDIIKKDLGTPIQSCP